MKPIDPKTVRLRPEQAGRHGGPKHRELVDSIRLHGLLQPPLVTEVGKDVGDGFLYDCIAGAGRTLAFIEARPGEPMPAIVRPASDCDLALTAVENLVRADYRPHEVFDILMALRQQGNSQRDIARLVSMDPGQVSRILSLERLIPAAMEKFRAGVFTLSVATEIAAHDNQHPAIEAACNGASREEIAGQRKRPGKGKPPADKVARMRFLLTGGATVKLERKDQLDLTDALAAARDAVKLLEWAEGEGLSAAVAAKAISERVRKPTKTKAPGEKAKAGS